jgi:hypothetical protein
MIEALVLLGYAVAAAWCAPLVLAPLTSRGTSPRLGLAAWLTAMGSVLAALGLGAERAVAVAAADWPQLTTALCRSVAGGACTPQIYRSALYEAGVTDFAAVDLAGTVYVRDFGPYSDHFHEQNFQRQLAGSALRGDQAGFVGVDDGLDAVSEAESCAPAR